MSDKVYKLVVGILGVLVGAAETIIGFINPDKAGLILGAIGIGYTAAIEILDLFRENTVTFIPASVDLQKKVGDTTQVEK